jgi:hypothetical protein
MVVTRQTNPGRASRLQFSCFIRLSGISNSDGIVEKLFDKAHSLLLPKEEKNEVGEGGSDPSTQAGLSTARCCAQVRYCHHPFYHHLTVHLVC